MQPNWKIVALVVAAVLLPVAAWAGKDFVMPKADPAKTYPAHDEHSDERVTVALDPYDMADKAVVFKTKYKDIGMLPIMLIITNDGDQPVSLANMKAQLVTVDRSKLSPATEDDIYRRLAKPSANTNPSPLPFPTKKVKGGVSKEAADEITNAPFRAKAVEPHNTQSGFLFFDVSGISTPLAGAQFYLTGVYDAKGNQLMYFEVPLEKYLSAPAKPQAAPTQR